MRRLRAQREQLSRGTAQAQSLKRELVQLSKELQQERVRAATLEGELSGFTNGHRWRTLKGQDPDKFDLIQKVQAYQRKLIRKTEEVLKLQLVLSDKERLYLQLRQIAQRLPGADVQRRCVELKRNCTDREKRVRALTADVNMYQVCGAGKAACVCVLVWFVQSTKRQFMRNMLMLYYVCLSLLKQVSLKRKAGSILSCRRGRHQPPTSGG